MYRDVKEMLTCRQRSQGLSKAMNIQLTHTCLEGWRYGQLGVGLQEAEFVK